VPVKDPDFEKGMAFFSQKPDSAFIYFNKVVNRSKDSLLVAKSYNYMSVIQCSATDYFSAQESLMRSLKFLNERKKVDFDCLSSNYNELGTNTFLLKNYNQALNYFEKSLRFCTDVSYRLIIMNNQATVYQKMGNYKMAIHIYEDITKQSSKNSTEYARMLSNIARTRWLQNPKYDALPDLLKALTIRKNKDDDWGINTSYAHLSDYYAATKPDAALYYAQGMYKMTKKLNSPDDQIEALQKLIRLSPATATKKYFTVYQHLADSLQTARNAAKNQYVIIRYESEKNKADNLRLQKDNTEKKYQLIKRDSILLTASILFIAVSVFSIFWYQKRKKKMAIDAEHAIRDSQLKTSKRVHDVVANGLYRMMTEIENQNEFDKENVLDNIEDLYEKSRDISYEKPVVSNPDFQNTISELLSSFATDERKILIAGNTPELWSKVGANVKYEVEHILQELLVNMKKHSGASNVAVKFEDKDHHIHIHYIDNGVGMDQSTKFQNGLRNTGNRIDVIHGEITFDTTAEKGLKILISFPIS